MHTKRVSLFSHLVDKRKFGEIEQYYFKNMHFFIKMYVNIL